MTNVRHGQGCETKTCESPVALKNSRAERELDLSINLHFDVVRVRRRNQDGGWNRKIDLLTQFLGVVHVSHPSTVEQRSQQQSFITLVEVVLTFRDGQATLK